MVFSAAHRRPDWPRPSVNRVCVLTDLKRILLVYSSASLVILPSVSSHVDLMSLAELRVVPKKNKN